MGIKSQSVPRWLLRLLLAPPSQQSRTGSIPKANDINTRTTGLFSTHNDSHAHPEPTSSSKPSGRRRFMSISSDNTNTSRKTFPHRIESSLGVTDMDLSRLLLDVLTEELVMGAQGPGKHVTICEIGVDSLMSFMVVSRLRKSLPRPSFDHIPKTSNNRSSSQVMGGRT